MIEIISQQDLGAKAMRKSFVYVALAAVVCAGVYLLTQAMNLLNQPSDWKVAGGVGLVVVVIVFFPVGMRWIWHRRTRPHGQLKSIGDRR
jgi:hypothetical protein